MDQVPRKPPNYAEIIREVLTSVNGPIAIEDFAARILQARPSNAKNSHLAALKKIREEQGHQLVYLDFEHVLPLRLAYKDARYRIRLTRENFDQSALSMDDCFQHYLPPNFRVDDIFLMDSQGNPILFKVIKAPHTITFSSEKKVEYQNPVIVLKEWFHSQKMYIKDHILVTVKDWEKGIFQIERERFGEQRQDLLAERNRYFADEFFKMLESAKYEEVHVLLVLPTIYARMPDKAGYPPDHWMEIVDNDPRMVTDGWSIRYPDSGFTQLERLFADATGQSLIPKGYEFSKEEAKYIYRFRALLKPKPTIWREIEIQGRQTLEDLDHILRIAFNHDTSDHLSGFWKKVIRTGSSKKRFREVDIGRVNPFESEEGSDTAIAALKLAIGDQIKYVYDFGDWIEHTLELKSIQEMEKGTRYPRETARNKPKYEYCTECMKKGKETVAAWICYTCSNEEQKDILLCEDCLERHEEHYADELLY
jgi:hypothetical protein